MPTNSSHGLSGERCFPEETDQHLHAGQMKHRATRKPAKTVTQATHYRSRGIRVAAAWRSRRPDVNANGRAVKIREQERQRKCCKRNRGARAGRMRRFVDARPPDLRRSRPWLPTQDPQTQSASNNTSAASPAIGIQTVTHREWQQKIPEPIGQRIERRSFFEPSGGRIQPGDQQQ